MKISFVIPMRNERDTMSPLVQGILKQVPEEDLQIVLVDDGSTDGSKDVLLDLESAHSCVETYSLGRAAGKSEALALGFSHAAGDVVFTMDGDLQDDPHEIPRFLQKLDEGWDMVCGWKAVRHDPWHKTLPSRVYNYAVGLAFGLALHDVNCGYKAMTREVAQRLVFYHEIHRLLPVMAAREGFRIGEIAVEHHPRKYGRSKYGFTRFLRGPYDVFALWLLFREDLPGATALAKKMMKPIR